MPLKRLGRAIGRGVKKVFGKGGSPRTFSNKGDARAVTGPAESPVGTRATFDTEKAPFTGGSRPGGFEAHKTAVAADKPKRTTGGRRTAKPAAAASEDVGPRLRHLKGPAAVRAQLHGGRAAFREQMASNTQLQAFQSRLRAEGAARDTSKLGKPIGVKASPRRGTRLTGSYGIAKAGS